MDNQHKITSNQIVYLFFFFFLISCRIMVFYEYLTAGQIMLWKKKRIKKWVNIKWILKIMVNHHYCKMILLDLLFFWKIDYELFFRFRCWLIEIWKTKFIYFWQNTSRYIKSKFSLLFTCTSVIQYANMNVKKVL